MARTRLERRWFRYIKGTRRIKSDRNEHKPYGQETLEEVCSCFSEVGSKEYGRVFSRFADTPAVCSGPCCGNPRKWYGVHTKQEEIAYTDCDIHRSNSEYRLGSSRE